MANGIKHVIFLMFLRIGFWIEKSSSSAEIRSFMLSLRPHKTNLGLMRMGCEFDGGYLIPNDLTGLEACFSPGVDQNSTFESDIAALGIKCHLLDFSVDQPPISNKMFSFTKKFLGRVNEKEFITFESWFNQLDCDPNQDYLLQMDIEGFEYEVIESTSIDFLSKFRIMVIEFHSLSLIRNSRELKKIKSVFEKIQMNFEILHLHVNNNDRPLRFRRRVIPRTIEVTFLRRDRILSDLGFAELPNELDRKNNPTKPNYPIPAELVS